VVRRAAHPYDFADQRFAVSVFLAYPHAPSWERGSPVIQSRVFQLNLAVSKWPPVCRLAGRQSRWLGVALGTGFDISVQKFSQNACINSKYVIQTRHFDAFADASCLVHQSKRSLAIQSLLALAKKLIVRESLRACTFSAGGVADLRQINQQLTWSRFPQ